MAQHKRMEPAGGVKPRSAMGFLPRALATAKRPPAAAAATAAGAAPKSNADFRAMLGKK